MHSLALEGRQAASAALGAAISATGGAGGSGGAGRQAGGVGGGAGGAGGGLSPSSAGVMIFRAALDVERGIQRAARSAGGTVIRTSDITAVTLTLLCPAVCTNCLPYRPTDRKTDRQR